MLERLVRGLPYGVHGSDKIETSIESIIPTIAGRSLRLPLKAADMFSAIRVLDT